MKLLDTVFSVIAPFECLSCGTEGKLLCSWCYPDAFLSLPDRCFLCKKLSVGSRVCPTCRRKTSLHSVWVRTNYDGLAKQLIHEIKFSRKVAAAETISEHMIICLPYLPDNVVVAHIPTASSRRRIRGYDQAELLAKGVATQLKLPYIGLLRRHGQLRQVGAKRDQRLRQLDEAFSVKNSDLVKDASILLVDDILTTGATLGSAAKVLKTAGAKRVYGCVFAQKA